MFKLKEETKLLPHQLEFVDFMLSKKTVGNFDEQGLGKTLETLAAICKIGKRALIVCPPQLANNWLTEINKFTELEIVKEISVCPQTMLEKRHGGFQGYDIVVFDEAHAFKNLNAKRTQLVHTYLMESKPEYFAYTTGTPIKNRIPEIYSFLLMISNYDYVNPKITDKYPTFYQFCSRFCHISEKTYGGTRSFMQFTGMKNVDELKTYISPWTIRRLAKNVLTLPNVENQRVYVNYKNDLELQKVWEEFESAGAVQDSSAKKKSALTKATFTSNYIANELECGVSPIVCFTDHPEAAHSIELSLSNSFRVASIVGGVSMSTRAILVDRFQKGELDALILTTGSSSSGITLTKASTMIFNDIPWVPADLDQAKKRIHRIGQESRCRYVFIVGSLTDDMIVKKITSKMKVIKTVMGDV